MSTIPVDPFEVVEAGYDRMADGYLRAKVADEPLLLAAHDELARAVPSSGTALDLGCGAGVPVTGWLAKRFTVTGVDVSARQLELARAHVPTASLIKASMTHVSFPPESFDVVVACHSIIHVPRTLHAPLLRRVHAWLKPSGAFLATWPLTEWEGSEENWEGWGARMWWSHYDSETYLDMLRDAGFSIASAEQRTSRDETWLWVLARKIDGGSEAS